MCLRVTFIVLSPLQFSHFHVKNYIPLFAEMTPLCTRFLCPHSLLSSPGSGDNWKENREKSMNLSISGMNAVCKSGCSLIVPQHKSFSASQCSLRSFPPSFPVGAIFNLPVQPGSTGLIATWIFWLCHCCRLG